MLLRECTCQHLKLMTTLLPCSYSHTKNARETITCIFLRRSTHKDRGDALR